MGVVVAGQRKLVRRRHCQDLPPSVRADRGRQLPSRPVAAAPLTLPIEECGLPTPFVADIWTGSAGNGTKNVSPPLSDSAPRIARASRPVEPALSGGFFSPPFRLGRVMGCGAGREGTRSRSATPVCNRRPHACPTPPSVAYSPSQRRIWRSLPCTTRSLAIRVPPRRALSPSLSLFIFIFIFQ